MIQLAIWIVSAVIVLSVAAVVGLFLFMWLAVLFAWIGEMGTAALDAVCRVIGIEE